MRVGLSVGVAKGTEGTKGTEGVEGTKGAEGTEGVEGTEGRGFCGEGNFSAFGSGEEGGEVAVAEDAGDEFGGADIFDVGEAETGFCEGG